MSDVSMLLNSARAGGADAANRIFELLCGDLRSLARAQLRKVGERQLLDTTGLVHESYLRFLNSGGGAMDVTLNTEIANSAVASNDDVLKVHDALSRLEHLDARLAKLVEMRYFAGLTEEETADALDLSLRTVQREWSKARLYLAADLSRE